MATTPTQRTIRALKDGGLRCAIVEKFNRFGGPHGIRQDMFGIIDILALDPQRGVVGVQCTGASGYQDHLRKLTVEKYQDTLEWLKTPGTVLELWSWRKVKKVRGGKAMVWKPRVSEIVLGEDETLIEKKVAA